MNAWGGLSDMMKEKEASYTLTEIYGQQAL